MKNNNNNNNNNNFIEGKNFEFLLSSIGLEKNEAKIYLESLKMGTVATSVLAKKVDIPRTTTRYICEQLVKKQIMIESKKGNTKLFIAENPMKLKNLIITQKNELEIKEKRIDFIMKDLINLQNPYSSLPKVTYYEGIDGIKKILFESLKAKEIVDSFVDTDSFIEYALEIDEDFAKKRKKLGLKKRLIFSNIEETQESIERIYKNNKNELNQIKFLDSNSFNLNTTVLIYDGKISYMVTKNGDFFGVIIENNYIYDFHKKMFEFVWNNLG